MTLTQLHYFQAVCKYGNISKASEFLNVSQPAVSKAIANLEAEFGVVLFRRENRLLEITNAGQVLLEMASDVLNGVNSIYQQMEQLKNNQSVFYIGIVSFSFSKIFQPILQRFQDIFPQTKIHAFECSSSAAIQMLKAGQIDVALAVDLEKHISYIDGLRLCKVPCVVAVSPKHPLSHMAECSVSDLSTQSLILAKTDSFLTEKIKDHFRQNSIFPKDIIYTSQISFITSMLESGTFAAVISQNLASELSSIVQIPISDPIIITPSLLWKRTTHLPKATAKFISLVKHFYPDAMPY